MPDEFHVLYSYEPDVWGETVSKHRDVESAVKVATEMAESENTPHIHIVGYSHDEGRWYCVKPSGEIEPLT
jgi:hypothetical protein